METPLSRLIPPRPGEADVELETHLREACAAARAGFPEIGLSDEDFVPYLGERLPAEGTLADALAGLQLGDLYLACACLRGLPRALGRLDHELAARVPGWIHAVGPELAGEVAQQLRVRLLVSDGEAGPKLVGYSGRGALLGWLRIAAVRTALNLRRSEGRRDLPVEDAAEQAARRMLDVGVDPELAFIKGRYRGALEEALAAGMRSLPVEQRNMLRMYFVGGLSAERIGAVLRVHQSTVSRWMAASRAAIYDEARRHLQDRLHLSPAEFDSLAGLLQSQVELSLGGLLRAGDDPAG